MEATISTDVAKRVDTRLSELEAQFDERDKSPYLKFIGPEDYGRLEFDYPRTYSMYVANDAEDGGTYQAYLHPNYVPSIKSNGQYALQVEILNESYENVTKKYKDNANLTFKSITSLVFCQEPTTKVTWLSLRFATRPWFSKPTIQRLSKTSIIL